MKMKAFLLHSILLAAAVSASAGLADLDNPGPSVSAISMRQRYPWNGLVDIDVSFTGNVGETYRIELSATDKAGGTNLPVRTAWLKGGESAVGNPVDVPAPGTHRLVWNAGADLPAGFVADRVTITAKLLNPIWSFESIPEIDPNDEWAPQTVYHDVQTVVSYGEIEDHEPTVRCLTDEWHLEDTLGSNVVFSGASMGLRQEGSLDPEGYCPISLWALSDKTNAYRMVTMDYSTGTIVFDNVCEASDPSSDIRFFQVKDGDGRQFADMSCTQSDLIFKSANVELIADPLSCRHDDEHGSAVCGYFFNGIPLSDSTTTTVPSSYDKAAHYAVFFCGVAGTDLKQAVVLRGAHPTVAVTSKYSCMKNPTGRYIVPMLDGTNYITVGHGSSDTNLVQFHRLFTGTVSQLSSETFDLGGRYRADYPDGYDSWTTEQKEDRVQNWVREPSVAYSKAVAMPDGESAFLGGAGRDADGVKRMWQGVGMKLADSRFADYPVGHPFESWARRDVTCLLPNGKFCGVDEELGLVVVNPLTGETYVASDDPVFKKGKMGCQLLPNGKVWIIPYDCDGREFAAGTNLCGKLYEVDFGFTRSFSLSSLCSPYLKVAEGDPEPSGIKVGLDPNGGELPGVYARYYKGANPVYGELPVPTRSGYAFLGWSTDGTAATVVSSADAVPASGIKLMAVWATPTYTVTFDKNDPEATGTMADQTMTRNVDTALNANAFARTGSTFVGWATSANGAKVYDDKQIVRNITSGSAITLYAVWEELNAQNALYMVVDLSGGANASSYPVSYLSAIPDGGWTDEYKTSKLVLRKIRSGSFYMGSPDGEVGRVSDEKRHVVNLSHAFYLGVFETTQEQYQRVMGTNPAYYAGGKRPVERISYEMLRGTSDGSRWPQADTVDGTSFFGVLRSRAGNLEFDLPTEAQWEYACRAGTASALNDGSNLSNSSDASHLKNLGRFNADQSDGKGGYSSKHTVVGCYSPNAWGLYDMHGNVFEWCLDKYGTYSSGPDTDPAGPSSGSSRVLRSGCFDLAPSCNRSAYRYEDGPTYRYASYGFRICLTLD